MKILITGGCGFVGSSIAIFLNKNLSNVKINTLDNFSRKGSLLNLRRLKKEKIKNYKYDISNFNQIQKLPKYNLIIDCCAESSVETSKKDIDKVFNTNLIGTFNILKKCNKDKSKIIFLSSSRVYPINSIRSLKINLKKRNYKNLLISEQFSVRGAKSIYGFTKFSSEELIKEFSYLFKTKYIINRLGVISGPWQFGKTEQGFVSLWVWNHLNKRKLSYKGYGGKGDQIRDILHVDDLCNLILKQIINFKKKYNLILNVGGGVKNVISLKELTNKCRKITRKKINIFSQYKTSIYDIPGYISDNSKVNKLYNWNPERNINNIIEDIYFWMILNLSKLKSYFK